MTNLRILSLARNNLTLLIDTMILPKSLDTLDLSFNLLTDLPQKPLSLAQPAELFLYGNPWDCSLSIPWFGCPLYPAYNATVTDFPATCAGTALVLNGSQCSGTHLVFKAIAVLKTMGVRLFS